MPNTAPPYTFGGITRPALIFDNAGNIILTPEAAAFQAAYGTKALYAGLPANTPYPPVAATLSAPLDNNGGINGVLENAPVGTQVGITAQANNNGGPPITYSLGSDNAGGRFQVNATTGVVTVAAALDFETAPGQAYNITVHASDGIFTTSQTFTIGVGNVNEAPAGTNNTVTASEDTNRVFTAADFGFTDPSDSISPNALAAVRITTLPATGTLLNNGNPVSAGNFISVADINAGLLVFVPAANTSGAGYASFTFQVRDTGGTANGGVDLDATPNTITINVNAVNDAPTATGLTQSLVINEDAAATQLFTAAPVVGDIDSTNVTATLTLNASAGVLVGAGAGVLNAGVLTYTITDTVANVNTALAAVTYDSAANFHGTANVGITVTDGANGPQGVNPTGTVSITVNSVNDAPAGADNTITASEDTNRVFTAADFGFSDTSDSPANALDAVVITTLPASGTLLNNGNPVVAGDAVSAAAIAAGQLVFVPAANASGAGYASFTFQVRDTGGTANGGVNLDASANTITVNVNAVNDAPTATGLTQSLTIGEDAAATQLFTVAPAVGDIDSASVTATLTLDAAAGVLVGAGAGVLNAGVLTYTITGAPATVNAALAAVTYDSAPDFNGATSVGVSIDDGANGPQGTNPTGSISITVNAVNDAPTATNLTQSLSIGEDAAAATLFTLPPVTSDVDSANVTATLTLDAAAGVLVGAGAGVLNAGVLTYTITGTAAAVNAALAAVTYDSASNFNGPTSVGVTIDDGAAGPQGTNPTGTISITVNAINDAPTATNLTQSLSIGEDDAATTLFTLSPVVSDIDSANVTATLSLDATAGVLTGAGAGVLNAGVLTYTITGTPAAVTAALAGVAFDSAPDFNGITDVGITIDDGANGPQGSNPIGTGTVTINAVNDAPTATNLTQSLSVGEDGAAATLFTLAPVVADIDSSNVTATLTLDAAAGVLTGAGAGVLNAGVLTYTITGTPAVVNAALAAVTYDSAADFNGPTSVGVTIDDGAAGPQGTNPTGTISITVNAVNDAPTASNLTQSININEDAAATTLFTLPPVTADIDSANVTATLTLDAAAGTLGGAGAGVLNAGVLTYTISGTPAAVNAALAAVTYESAPDFFGTPSVGVTIDDGANGPQGSNPAGSIGITVNSVNDAPTLAATANNPAYVPGADLFSGVTASTVESGQTITQLVLTVSNISDTDESLTIDGDIVSLVDGTVSGAPTATLGVSYSVAVSGGTATITITSPGLTEAQTATLIDALSYTNSVVSPGDPARVVTIVSLTDNGGNALGGVDTGTPGIASTVNFNVAPSIDVDNTVNYVENDAATQIDSTVTVSDPDDTHMESATVAITSGFAVGEDVLTFINTANITGNLVGNTLTATGHATLAEYETFLESVRYQNTSNDPSVSDRIVTYTVNDGFVDSPSDTATIHVAARNDEPTLTATAANPGFTENGAVVDLFSSPSVSTVEAGQTLNQIIFTVTNVAGTGATESLRIDGTTVELTNGNSEVTLTNGMTASVVLAGGTATVTVSRASGISAADMATLVDNLAYGNTSEDPGSANRVVTVTSLRDDGLNGGGNDNINSALAVASTVTVTPVNDEPTLTATANGGGAVTFTETSLPAFAGSGPVDLFSSPSTSTVEAGQTVTQVVLSVTNVADTTEFLTIGATAVDLVNGNSEAVTVGGAAGTATVSVVAGVATVTVTPTTTFSAANVNALVDSLAYSNNDDTPTATTHTISVTSLTDSGANGGANDNTGSPSISTVVTVVATNDGPVAVNDTFTGLNGAITNTALVVDGPTPGTADPAGVQKVITGNILANDADADGGPLSVVAGTFVTAQGGSVTLDADGGFVYVPLPNTDGTVDTSDSFTYTVTDGNPGGQNGTATATVTINFVPNSTIWYVDGSYAGANGPSDGSSLRPFTDFSQLNGAGGAGDVDAAGDTIFIYDGTYTGNLELESGQSLFGERHGLDAPDGGGAAGVTTLLAANAGAGLTQINGTITASSNNSIQAISWGDSAGVSLTGTNVGALHVNDANAASAGSINNATGGAVSINGSTAGMNLQFANVSSGAGTAGISLTNALGTFNATGGTLSGHTASEISISGGTGTITYGGTIGNGTGDSAQINNRTGGTVTLSGNINDTNDVGGGIGVSGNANTTINFTGTAKTLNTGIGDGVSMTNNTGTSNVNFTNGGLNINTSNGTGFQATVAGTYSVTGTGNSITTNGNGAALNLDTIVVGAGGLTFDSTSSTNSTGTAVAIDSVTGGAIALGSGSISGSDGDAFRVGDGAGTANTGGTSAITYAGSISKTDGSGQAVDIQDRAAGAGNITLSGNITHNVAANTGILLDDNAAGTITFSGTSKAITSGTATGVNLTDNAGATIAFTNGGLVINTTAGNGFNATGPGAAATSGGTVTVEGSGNTITSTTGTALNVVHTTIGANDLTFQSIAANGGASGIVLNNTGTSGNLNVTGTGATDGTGGTIQNTTGHGVSLTSTQDVNLRNMNISGADGNGIFGNGVNGLVLQNLNISGNGDSTTADGEGNIYLYELTGNASHVTTFDDLNVTNSYVHNVFIQNTGGTLTDLVVTDSTFSNNGASTVAASQFTINLATGGVAGTPTATVHATHNTFSGNLSTPATFTATGFQGSSNDGTLNVHIGDGTAGGLNTFNTNNSGITLGSALAGNLNFDVNNNTITNNRAVGVGINHFGTGTVTGFFQNNTIGTQGVTASGAQIGNGLSIDDESTAGTVTLSVTNNIIQSVGGTGLGFEGVSVTVGNGAQTSATTMNLTLTGNTIRDIIDDRGLYINNFNNAGGGVINALVSGNTFTNANASGANTTARIGGEVPGFPVNDVNVTQTNAATLAAANGLTASAAPGNTMRVDANVSFNHPAPPAPPATPQMAANGQGPGSSEAVTLDALAPLLAVAIANWAAAGASAAQIAQMQNAAAHIRIADLPNSGFLANSDEHGITIDSNAAGWGWFIDSTPTDNAEYQATTLPGQLAATGGSAASHIDLLTVLEHELGHVVGLTHSDDAGVMNATLDTGERRLPGAADVALADAGPVQAQAYAQAPLLPVVRGTAGNDTLDAGHGGVILVGEAGADNFVFANVDVHASASPTLTHVADYKFAEGDVFDFSALTASFHGSNVNDAFVVRAVEDASGTFATLQVNTANFAWGSKVGPQWTDVAQIDGAHAGDDVGVMIDSQGAVHLAHLHVGLLA